MTTTTAARPGALPGGAAPAIVPPAGFLLVPPPPDRRLDRLPAEIDHGRRPHPATDVTAIRGGMVAPASCRPRRSPYAHAFATVLSRVEEALAGERPADGAATRLALIDRLQEVSQSSAPQSVRTARTLPALHAALLAWQDRLEIRDGRRSQRPLARSA